MGMTSISPLEAIFIAIGGLVTVFIVLAVISMMIVLISKIIVSITGKQKAPVKAEPVKTEETASKPELVKDENTYGGDVALIDVDEKTAACVMAIVSHETGIPLSQLIFKKIKLL